MLWFDVESRYETTKEKINQWRYKLWFDVESRYETTMEEYKDGSASCGLMQNQDMKQRIEITKQDEKVVV